MNRKIMDQLIEWNNIEDKTPVLLTGAKAMGKTYLAYDFAKSFFEHILYVNFERDFRFQSLFTKSIEEIVDQLLNFFSIPIDSSPQSRILILDEISFCSEALEKVMDLQEYFARIILISSNPIVIKEEEKFMKLPVCPLGFDEFLLAIGHNWYVESILTHYESNKPLPEIVHKELLALHELYLTIGGMPGIMNEYLNFNSSINIAEQHILQLGAYHNYIEGCCADSGEALKMNQVISSIPQQLMKNNKKFQYKLIRKGTTQAMYKGAIDQLDKLGYVLQSMKYTTDQLLSLYQALRKDNKPSHQCALEIIEREGSSSFKLYLPDVGFLSSQLVEDDFARKPSTQKALLENYVAQALHNKEYPLIFWESDSIAKVDFLLAKDKELIPVEIHYSDNTRSKSLSILRQSYKFPYAVKISSKNFNFSNQIKYIPYYAVFCL